ncbi:MAG: aspartate-semialdehyde dehydrogenase [Sandaracinaceae bacterium]|nr:aspartate-semialdehyde dehydrogenase [Sandaracinaceae bacterium]
MTKKLDVAVLGATGAVGQEMLRVLEQRDFPVGRLVALASPKSAGRTVTFRGEPVRVEAVTDEAFEGVDVALFSAGGGTSREWAPKAAARGATVIDNSSAWRMDPDVPLCVPEVNLEAARERKKGIVANPNCSTIQMVVALQPLHREARVRRVVVSTYQAISGAGAKAVDAFEKQLGAYVRGEAPTPRSSAGSSRATSSCSGAATSRRATKKRSSRWCTRRGRSSAIPSSGSLPRPCESPWSRGTRSRSPWSSSAP